MTTEMEDEIMKMSAYERQTHYEREKNQLLDSMKGCTAEEIQKALQDLIEKWRV